MPLGALMSLDRAHTSLAVDAACLLTVKYLKGQLSPDLQEMVDKALKLFDPSRIEFEYIIDAKYNFTEKTLDRQSISETLDWTQEHFGNDLAHFFDNALRNIRFQVEVIELTNHAPQFPKIVDYSMFAYSGLSRMVDFLEELRRRLNDAGDPRLQDTELYYDLLTRHCVRFIQACREYAHIPGLSEEGIVAEVRRLLPPGFVLPGPRPRVPTKSARIVKTGGDGAVPESNLAEEAAEAQDPSVAQAHGDQ